MTKYMVFEWSNRNVDKDAPADGLLGTCDGEDLLDEVEYDFTPGKGVTFGMHKEIRPVKLVKNLMLGKTFDMIVYTPYGKEGPEERAPMLAYYEIPGTNNE